MKSKKASVVGECREREQPLDIKALKKRSRGKELPLCRAKFSLQPPLSSSVAIRYDARRPTETPGLSLTILNFRRRCYQFTDRTGRVSTLRSAYTHSDRYRFAKKCHWPSSRLLPLKDGAISRCNNIIN